MAGRKVFAPATVLTAADVNNFLMDQAVMVFADSAARTTAIPTPTEGMVTYLEDTNLLEVFTGASFVPIAEDSPITTEGDLIIGDASGDPVRLAVGAADTVLTSDGTTLSFAAPAGGGGLTVITSGNITEQNLTLSSIPQTFRNLLFFINFNGGSSDRLRLMDNNNLDAFSGNYGFAGIRGSGATLNAGFIDPINSTTNFTIQINNYTDAGSPKGGIFTLNSSTSIGSTANSFGFTEGRGTAAISSLKLQLLDSGGSGASINFDYILFGVN